MKIKKSIYPVILLSLVVGLWYFFTNVYGIREIFLPSPGSTIKAFFELVQKSEFWVDLGSLSKFLCK